MNKIITYSDSYQMGETALTGIVKETVIKLDQSKQRCTGIDLYVDRRDSASAKVTDDHGVIVNMRDSKEIILDQIFADKLKHGEELPSDERFFPLDINAKSNELRLSFTDNQWVVDGSVTIYIMLRYE